MHVCSAPVSLEHGSALSRIAVSVRGLDSGVAASACASWSGATWGASAASASARRESLAVAGCVTAEGAGRHVQSDITGGGDPCGDGHLEEHHRGRGLDAGEEIPVVDRIFNDEQSLRRLIGRFPDRRLLRACYQAGPGGYDLYRLLASMGVACDVTWSPRR